jgi:hypothetical protein
VIYELWLDPSGDLPATDFVEKDSSDKARVLAPDAVLLWSVEASSDEEARRSRDAWQQEHGESIWEKWRQARDDPDAGRT